MFPNFLGIFLANSAILSFISSDLCGGFGSGFFDEVETILKNI
jgi:hypothetical protein